MKRRGLYSMIFLVALTAWSCAAGFSQHTATGLPSSEGVDPLNANYRIDGQEVRLREGRFEAEAAPGSAEKTQTIVFGQPVYGDLDNDGNADAALFLIRRTGGSGTFVYVAAAINIRGTFRGTNAVLIGDRVTPKSLEIRNGIVIVNYDDRRPGEPMAASPSVAKTLQLVFRNGVFGNSLPWRNLLSWNQRLSMSTILPFWRGEWGVKSNGGI